MCKVLPHLRTEKPPEEACPEIMAPLGIAPKAEGRLEGKAPLSAHSTHCPALPARA